MVNFNFLSPPQMAVLIAKKAREKRLFFNFSQQTLSQRSGVSFGVIKKFERTGLISLGSLLKLAVVLDCLDDFAILFPEKQPQQFATLDALLKDTKRKRGRK